MNGVKSYDFGNGEKCDNIFMSNIRILKLIITNKNL